MVVSASEVAELPWGLTDDLAEPLGKVKLIGEARALRDLLDWQRILPQQDAGVFDPAQHLRGTETSL
jgi:hypothetical protein